MSRVIFPGYASDDCGETVVPAEIEQVTEFGLANTVDRSTRTVTVQLPQGCDLPDVGHEIKLVFNKKL